jgi:type III pantothenate kinase
LCFQLFSMVLVIDVGNTQIKLAIFQQDTLLNKTIIQKHELQKNIENILNTHSNITNLVVSSVGEINQNDFLPFQNLLKIHFISHLTPFPFQNLYKTPKTLGIDRLVLATGAVLQFPNQNRLIIDAGTCITYDFINHKNQYLGGAISPGIRLRYESLHNYTAKLPLLTLLEPEDFIGNSTEMSIHSGVINGLANEMDGFINLYKQDYENFKIILTGGDANFLAKRLKNTIFANSNFLLESLNKIYKYIYQND